MTEHELVLPVRGSCEESVLPAPRTFRQWLLLGLIYLAVSTLTRVALIGLSMAAGLAAWTDVPRGAGVGAVYDIVTALYRVRAASRFTWR